VNERTEEEDEDEYEEDRQEMLDQSDNDQAYAHQQED